MRVEIATIVSVAAQTMPSAYPDEKNPKRCERSAGQHAAHDRIDERRYRRRERRQEQRIAEPARVRLPDQCEQREQCELAHGADIADALPGGKRLLDDTGRRGVDRLPVELGALRRRGISHAPARRLRLRRRRAACGSCRSSARDALPSVIRVARHAVQFGLDLSRMRREQQDPAADPDRLGDRVRDEEHGEARVVPELQQLVLHLAARERVERREGLVHQQDIGFHRHPARDGHALLHSTGQRMRQAVGEFRQVDLGDCVSRLLPCRLGAEPAARDERKHHVLGHRLPRQQLVEFLEYHHPVGPRSRHDLAFETDPALDRIQVAADRLQQRRLAAARRAEQDEAVGLEDLEIDAIRRGDEVVLRLVLQRDAIDVEQRLHQGLSCRQRRGCSGRTGPSTSPA